MEGKGSSSLSRDEMTLLRIYRGLTSVAQEKLLNEAEKSLDLTRRLEEVSSRHLNHWEDDLDGSLH